MGGGFDDLDEHPASILGVDEVDPAVARAALGQVIEQSHPAFAQCRADGIDVDDAVGHLLDAGAGLGQEAPDRRVGMQRREQLDARAGVTDGHHRLADTLLLVDLLVQAGHPKGVAVERDRGVEVGDRDPDVVDHREQTGERAGSGRYGGVHEFLLCQAAAGRAVV